MIFLSGSTRKAFLSLRIFVKTLDLIVEYVFQLEAYI